MMQLARLVSAAGFMMICGGVFCNFAATFRTEIISLFLSSTSPTDS